MDRELIYVDDFEPTQNDHNSGQRVVRNPDGTFAEGHPKMGGMVKGYKSPKRAFAETWAEIPKGQTMTRGEAMVLKMWNMAIVEGDVAIIKTILGYLAGMPEIPVNISGEVSHTHVIDKKMADGLEKVFEALENLKKPIKTFTYEEAQVKEKTEQKMNIEQTKKDEQPTRDPRIGTFTIPPDPD